MAIDPHPIPNWQALVEIDRLQSEREGLLNRIQKLRPREHKRVVLEADLQKATRRQLELSRQLRRNDL